MIADDGKQKTFDIHNTAMINLKKKLKKKHVKQLKKKHPEEKSSKQSSADTFIFFATEVRVWQGITRKRGKKELN